MYHFSFQILICTVILCELHSMANDLDLNASKAYFIICFQLISSWLWLIFSIVEHTMLLFGLSKLLETWRNRLRKSTLQHFKSENYWFFDSSYHFTIFQKFVNEIAWIVFAPRFIHFFNVLQTFLKKVSWRVNLYFFLLLCSGWDNYYILNFFWSQNHSGLNKTFE